mgnify:FL=1
MRKLLAYFRVHLSEALVYRATGFIWLLNDIGPAIVALLFWLAAFQDQSLIAGYTVASMSLYYFGVMAINALIVPYPEYNLVEEIRSGSFSNYLVKPINLIIFKMCDMLAWRIPRVFYLLPLIFILNHFSSGKQDQVSLNLITLGVFMVSLCLSFLLMFFIKMILALMAIWFTESGWLFFSFEIFSSLFSGELVPLSFLPGSVQMGNNWLPFKYFLSFPLLIVLQKINSSDEIGLGLLTQLFWVILGYLAYRFILNRGIKNYCAYGG